MKHALLEHILNISMHDTFSYYKQRSYKITVSLVFIINLIASFDFETDILVPFFVLEPSLLLEYINIFNV